MAARTLQSLRTELAQRLGFSSSGSGAILQKELLNSALRSGQEQLYYEFGDLLTHIVNNTEPGSTVSGVSLYEFPVDCDPQKALTVSAQRETGSPFTELSVGIGVVEHNSEPALNNQFPVRWDIINHSKRSGAVKPKLEVWPTPDAVYSLKLEYNASLGPFSVDTDTSTINPMLILLHAIVTMKAHYQQPDFQFYAGQLESLLGRIRAVGLQAGGSTSRYFKQTQAFSLEPESTWPISSSVTTRINNIISDQTFIIPATGSDTYIVTADS